VVEPLPGVVADQQGEPPGLLDEDGVVGVVGHLVQRDPEQERIAGQEDAGDDRERERPGPG
jgi:hypothetical protein